MKGKNGLIGKTEKTEKTEKKKEKRRNGLLDWGSQNPVYSLDL